MYSSAVSGGPKTHGLNLPPPDHIEAERADGHWGRKRLVFCQITRVHTNPLPYWDKPDCKVLDYHPPKARPQFHAGQEPPVVERPVCHPFGAVLLEGLLEATSPHPIQHPEGLKLG